MISPIYNAIKTWLVVLSLILIFTAPPVGVLHPLFWIIAFLYLLVEYTVIKSCLLFICKHPEDQNELMAYLKEYTNYTFTFFIIPMIIHTIDHDEIDSVKRLWKGEKLTENES